VRKSNAAAKNDVESYIINTRDTLASDDTYSTISTEEERASISSELERAEDWLYEEGREMDAKAYAAKLKELKAMVAPVALRASEMVARPKVKQAKSTLAALGSRAPLRGIGSPILPSLLLPTLHQHTRLLPPPPRSSPKRWRPSTGPPPSSRRGRPSVQR
jgi:hypothetical protein